VIKIQVVGCPERIYHRLSRKFDDFAVAQLAKGTAEIRHSPSDQSERSHFTAAQLRDNFIAGFYHAALFPMRQGATVDAQLARLGAYDYRLTWLRFQGDVVDADWATIERELQRVVDYEVAWSGAIRPADHNHPLLLPPTAFEPSHECQGYWKTCDCYSDKVKIERARNVLETVRKTHRAERNGARWVDRRDRQFSIDRSAHGRNLDDRSGLPRARFCFTVNAGFHYDVVHSHGRRFTVNGNDGVAHTQIKRANIDPWGAVRVAS
jgi:hypothetical protein